MVWPLKEKPFARPLPEPVLKTDRLFLRPAAVHDYTQWADVRARNKNFLKPYEPTWPDKALEPDFFHRRVERLLADARLDRGYAFLIFEKDEEKLVGGININNITRGAAQYASLGYWLDEGSQGNGYMTESAHAVLAHAFSVLALDRMNAATLVHNQKSRAMLTRLGFVEEGFAKAYIQINGRRQDHVLFGLNAEDFLSAS